jgi:hypothetical protein
MRRYRCGSASFRMNVALSELPAFDDSGPQGSDIHRSGILIAPSLQYMDRAHLDARRNGMSAEPVIEMLVPSTLDDSLAPAGAHVASLFCQHFAPAAGRAQLSDERDAATIIIDTVNRHAPNFRHSIVGASALYWTRSGAQVPSGDIFRCLGLDQLGLPSVAGSATTGPESGTVSVRIAPIREVASPAFQDATAHTPCCVDDGFGREFCCYFRLLPIGDSAKNGCLDRVRYGQVTYPRDRLHKMCAVRWICMGILVEGSTE